MHEATIRAFADELLKISGVPKGMLAAAGKGASPEAKTYLFNRLNAHALGRRASESKFPQLSKRLEARSWGKVNREKSRGVLSKISAVVPANSKSIADMKAAVRGMKHVVSRLSEKRATMVKYTDPRHRPRVKTASELSKKINADFGLPLVSPRNKGVRRYENGPAAAQSADASQYPVAGMATPNISASNTMSPAYGPGGV